MEKFKTNIYIHIIVYALNIFLFDSCSSIKQIECKKKYPDAYSVGEIVRHKAYALSYNEQFEQPNWVEYYLRCSDFNNPVKRSNDYREDPLVKTKTLTPDDYKYSGYDQGHIAPARDMARGHETMSESFYLSNMSPQLPYFNRHGLWKKSESSVRKWACKSGVVHVIAGPIVNDAERELSTIVQRKKKLFIPAKFFKIVRDSDKKMIGFIFPHSETRDDIMKYVTTVDEVERQINIDFFSEIPDEIEEKLEATTNVMLWE